MGKGKRSSSPSSSVQQVPSGNDDYYEVEEILDRRKNTSGMLYLIKWKNYPDPKDFTWEPIQHLSQVKDLVAEFQRNYEANRSNKTQSRIAQYLPKVAHEKTEKLDKKQKLDRSERSERIQREKSDKQEKKQKRQSSPESEKSEMQVQQAEVVAQKRRGRKKNSKNKNKMIDQRQKSDASSSEEEKMNSIDKNNQKGKDKKEIYRRRNRSKQRQIEARNNGNIEKDKLRKMLRERLFEEKTNLKLGRVCKHYYIDGHPFFNVNILGENDRVVNLATISLAELKAVDEDKLLRYLQQYYQNYLRMEEFKQTDEYLNFEKHWKNIS